MVAIGLCALSMHAQENQDSAKPAANTPQANPTLGFVERLSDQLDSLIPPDAVIEVLAEGFEWTEGPVWDKSKGRLLFSDIPVNTVFQWDQVNGLKKFLYPSGYTGQTPRGGEPGSNGLLFNKKGDLILCQHGDRRISRLRADGTFDTLVQYYKYRRLNSPNDAVYKSNGDLYFTDPPYGLEGKNQDPTKELLFNGVYRFSADGKMTKLTDRLTFPNGIAFSPDEKTLYVAVSDPNHPVWMAYDVNDAGLIENGRLFFNSSHLMGNNSPGLPDGLKVDMHGNLFATGPGGVLILSPEGTHLGTIRTGVATANCAWGNDGSVLYITADMYLLRIKTSTMGDRYMK